MTNIIGTYSKRIGLNENVTAIAEIIRPYTKEKYDDVENKMLADLIWSRIYKVQHHHIHEQTIIMELLTDATAQYENIMYQCSYSKVAQKQYDRFKAKVLDYK